MEYYNTAVVVLSQSCTIEKLNSVLADLQCYKSVICLSTHHFFQYERKIIADTISTQVIFHQFADFLTDVEMEACDIKADGLIVKKYNYRNIKLLGEYYENIKRIKNTTVIMNLENLYVVDKYYILSDDLGIDIDAWKGDKSIISISCNYSNESDIRTSSWLGNIKKRYNIFMGSAHYLCNGQERFIVLGSIGRVKQYFHKNTIISQPAISITIFLLLTHLIYKSNIVNNNDNSIVTKIIRMLFKILMYDNVPLACTIHGFNRFYSELARVVNVPLHCIQDGFLPNNYTSKYLLYYESVSEFLVWDSFSMEIFDNHQLKSRISKIFFDVRLPRIDEKPRKIKNVLVLTSGAGDWTAIKNRSDDDLLLELFVRVAIALPHIKITYRPHPLWVHPSHQGINSISRVETYLKLENLPNLSISAGSVKESIAYKDDNDLSRKSTTIQEEVNKTNIIFGEHSQSLINGARNKKLFGSVNITNRRSIFKIYDDLGFPHFKSHQEIISFIKDFEVSAGNAMMYNNSVDRFNSMCYMAK